MFAARTWASALGGINHPLLADFWPHGGVAQAFGIFNDAVGIANRTVFIIDPEGIVRHSELHQGTLPDVDAVLAKLAELQG
jgi:mycoredoxin-dependent peroxiredoxin